MSKVIWTAIILPVIVVFLGIATLGHEAYAQEENSVLACYFWSAFPNERLKLNIELHSPLSEREEEKKFGHPAQTAYSVHGKEVGGCGGNTMGAVTGTVVTAEKGGAHMGIVAHFSRGSGKFFGRDFCRSITFDCTTKEDSPAPDSWQCQSRNEFDVYHGISELKKVDEMQDPRCSIFENGSFTGALAQDMEPSPIITGSAAVPGLAGITSGGPAPAGRQGVARIGQGDLDSAVGCYARARANGVDDLTARFFCGLRPFPPWLLELDDRNFLAR